MLKDLAQHCLEEAIPSTKGAGVARDVANGPEIYNPCPPALSKTCPNAPLHQDSKVRALSGESQITSHSHQVERIQPAAQRTEYDTPHAALPIPAIPSPLLGTTSISTAVRQGGSSEPLPTMAATDVPVSNSPSAPSQHSSLSRMLVICYLNGYFSSMYPLETVAMSID